MSRCLLLAGLLLVLSGTSIQADDTQTADVWIFAGQSNMRISPQFQAFRATIQKRFPDKELEVVASQRSGRPIEHWHVDGGNKNEKGKLWQAIVDGVKGKEKRVKGMVWYQGESNANKPREYEAELRDLFQRVRKLAGNEQLPVIVVQLAAVCPAPDNNWGFGLIREAQRRYVESDPFAALVPTIDLPIGDNLVHLSGQAQSQVGQREAFAALRLAYGIEEAYHGPQFEKALFADDSRTRVVVSFNQVQGQLQLQEGFAQGFSLVRGLDWPSQSENWQPEKLPAMERALESPIAVQVLGKDKVLLTFTKPLSKTDRISWAAAPNATFGLHRRFELEFAGLTDDSDIIAPAFVLVPVKAKPPEFRLPKFDEKKILTPKVVSANEPFQIAVNGIGRKIDSRLQPDAVAGAPDYRQKNWNSAVRGLYPNLIDSKGRVSNVGLVTTCWYASTTNTNRSNADGKMMSSNNGSADKNAIVGLTPGASYDLVLYADPPNKKQNVPVTTKFTLGTADKSKKARTVKITEPNLGTKEKPFYDFKRYVEATAKNNYTGNYVVIRDVVANSQGEIPISIECSTNRAALTGLQIFNRK